MEEAVSLARVEVFLGFEAVVFGEDGCYGDLTHLW